MNARTSHTTVTTNHAPAGTQATVEHRSQPQPISSINLTLADGLWIVMAITAIIGLYAAIRKLVKDKKEEERHEANERAKIVTDAIELSRRDHERESREIKEKFAESKELIERDIADIKQRMQHVDNNARQRDDALKLASDRIEFDRRADFTRIVQLEAKFEALVTTMSDVKGLIKESREEHKAQFDQICNSIREMSKRTVA